MHFPCTHMKKHKYSPPIHVVLDKHMPFHITSVVINADFPHQLGCSYGGNGAATISGGEVRI